MAYFAKTKKLHANIVMKAVKWIRYLSIDAMSISFLKPKTKKLNL